MEKGDFIRIDYVGRVKDVNEIFDLTIEEVAKKEGIYNEKRKYRPACIILGEGMLIKGLEEGIMKMNVGEKKTIEVSYKDAFGERNPELVRTFSIDLFKKQNIDPKHGLIVNFSGLIGRVQSVTSGRVRVDFNHPLAGKDLVYEVEIKEKVEDPKEKLKFILEIFEIEAESDLKDKEAIIKLEKKSLSTTVKRGLVELIKKYIKVDKVVFIEEF